MTDVRRWLADDPLVLNTVLAAVAASALAACLWYHSLPSTTQQPPVAAPAAEQRDRKSTRSKERRRRGKDPFRDLFKGGKKSKALLKAFKATDHSPPSADTLSNASVPHIDTASSTSRSQSPDPASDTLDMNCPVESGDSSPRSRSMTPNGNSSSTSAVASSVDISDHSSSDAGSQVDSNCTRSLPPDSITAADTDANVSAASTIMREASEDPSSSPRDSTACADIRTPQLRDSQAAYTSGSCAKLVRARTRLRLSKMDPTVKAFLLSSAPSPLPDSVANMSNSIHPCQPLSIISSTHSADGAGPSTPTNSRGSTPPRSLDTCEKEPNTQPLDQSTAIELASMRNALEAARLREEELRAEVEQASKERDELRWGWNEESSVWRRREAELQAQIHHLMQQLQAYAAVASFQAQQASSGFSSPTSPHMHSSPRLQQHPLVSFPPPPPMQAQNSASAPPHVQALLASAPMLTPHSPGHALPSGSPYPGAGFGMSPLLWSGLGLCVPNRDTRRGGRRTPDSSASGSSRGRRRQRGETRSASDESSLGEWDGMEDGSGDEDLWEEEEEDIFRNNMLADAILKRPESIRGLSNAGKRRRPMQGNGAGERMDALKDPALAKPGFVPPPVDTSAVGQ